MGPTDTYNSHKNRQQDCYCPDWDWDVMPCELRLDDGSCTVVLRVERGHEPDDRTKRLIGAGPKLCRLAAKLVRVKDVADGGVVSFANQGQALDGYSELANYRSLIDDLRKVLETL